MRRGRGWTIDYRVAAVEDVDGAFDLVTAMEVIEHAADPQRSSNALAQRLAPDGLLILSTPERTAWSRLITITLAEGIGAIPKGTHDFDKFIAPERMKQLMANAGLKCLDVEGIGLQPDARASPQRGRAAELSGGGDALTRSLVEGEIARHVSRRIEARDANSFVEPVGTHCVGLMETTR